MTDAVETHAFVYTGPRRLAGLVAETLLEDGLSPESWIARGQPPGLSTAIEAGSLAEIAWIPAQQQVTVVFLVCSSDAQLRVAIANSRERLQGGGTIDWKGAHSSTAKRRADQQDGPQLKAGQPTELVSPSQ
jgi:hypothetical protein